MELFNFKSTKSISLHPVYQRTAIMRGLPFESEFAPFNKLIANRKAKISLNFLELIVHVHMTNPYLNPLEPA